MALLTACSHGDLAANPSRAQLATPEAAQRVTAVRIPAGCGRLAGAVAKPTWHDGDLAGVVIRKLEIALDEANARIGAHRSCVRRIVDSYAAGLRR